jgi:zinc protease
MTTLSLPGAHNITRVELENGITVLAYENFAAQSVVITGSLEAGALHYEPYGTGIPSLTASALMRGTQSRDFGAFHAALEDIGADLNISAGVHSVGFNGKALAEDLPVLLDLLNDALRYPAFPAEPVERLRGEILTMLQYRQYDTGYRANRAFRQQTYPAAHPYHHTTRGTLETLPQVTLDDLHTFHRDHYGPRGMVLVIVGAVQAAEAVEMARARLGDWHNPAQPERRTLPSLDPIQQTRRVDTPIPGKSQSDLVIGVPGPSRRADDFRAATLANSVFGQFGMMGRIGDVVREQMGLAYYAYSSVEGGQGPGAWSVSAGVNPQNIERAIEAIRAEIARLIAEPVTEEELADNQAYFTGILPLQLESNEGLAGTLLNTETYDLGLDYLLTVRDKIRALTREDLLAAARHYWNPAALVISVAGPNGG